MAIEHEATVYNQRHKDHRGQSDAKFLIAIIGAVMIVLGLASWAKFLTLSIASPFTLTGATCYLVAGAYLSLSFSATLRMAVLQLLPTALLEVLFKKSLIEVVEEITHPVRKPKKKQAKSARRSNPMMKGYELLAVAGTLEHEEIQQLADALPRECDFMKRPGLLHLFPKLLRSMLNGDGIVDDIIVAREHQREQRVIADIQAQAEALAQAQAQQEHDQLEATSSGSGFFAPPAGLLRQNVSQDSISSSGSSDTPTAVQLHSATATNNGRAGDRAASAAAATLEEEGAFEIALHRVVKKHIKRLFHKLMTRLVAKMSSASYFLLSGGRLSNSLVGGLFTVSLGTLLGAKFGGKLLDTSAGKLVLHRATIMGLGGLFQLQLSSVLSTSTISCVQSLLCTVGMSTGTMLTLRQLASRKQPSPIPTTSVASSPLSLSLQSQSQENKRSNPASTPTSTTSEI